MRGSRLKTRLFLVGLFLVLLVIAAAGWVVRSFTAMARWGPGLVEAREDVGKAAERMRAKDADARAARQELREKVRAARDEGISFAAIARAAKLRREWTRRLYSE